MKTTFTEIHWKSQEDSDIFNVHAIKSITLEGMSYGKLIIEGACGTFEAPYYNLHFGDHYELVTCHPHDCEYFISIAIYANKVYVEDVDQSSVCEWFKDRCKNFNRYW